MASRRILIVEDSLVNQHLAKAILTKAGHTVKLANNGREGVELAQSEPFDFVLMDVRMPEMDGLVATRLIRESEADTGKRLPIVALTASDDRETCLEAGMDDFMTKPVHAAALLDTVVRLTSPSEAEAAKTPQRAVNILLIDDSQTAVAMVAKLLEQDMRSPYSLETRKSLAAGLQRLGEGNIDLVLLDLNLEDSLGLKTFQRVRDTDPELPIIILTSEDDETLSVTAVRDGAHDYLVKWRFDSKYLTQSIHFNIERAKWAKQGEQIQLSQRQYVARSIQEDILPKEPAPIPGVDLHGRCEFGDLVSGDFFDYVPMLRDNWGLVIGSMVGLGLRAVMKMVEIRAVMRSLVPTRSDLSYIVSRASQVVETDLQLDEAINLTFVRVDSKNLSIQYLSTAELGVLLDRRGALKQRLQPTILPIRAHSTEGPLATATLDIEPGDVLLLWSPSVAECRAEDGSCLNTATLSEHIVDQLDSPAKVLVEMLFQEVYRQSGTRQLNHDISFVVARFVGDDQCGWSI